MAIEEMINEKKPVRIFIDMDGTLADYQFQKDKTYKTKRPLYSVIKKVEKWSTIPYIELNILSVCKTAKEMEDKYIWLDKYIKFIKPEHQIILCKLQQNTTSAVLKTNYLKALYDANFTNILIDDDPSIIKMVRQKLNGKVHAFHVSDLID